MKLLIVEDEIDLLLSISNYLTKEGYHCELADNFFKAEEKIQMYEYDLILLDITLGNKNGLDLLKPIRKYNIQAGIIILSARNSLDDKVNGLDLGADDYMTKPFQLTELNSRIKALLRRRRFEGSPLIVFNEIQLNTDTKSVMVHDQPIVLTRKEYELLLYFMVNKNRVLTKEAIAEHLWEDNIDLSDHFDFIYTHMNNLRKKIRRCGGKDYIKTLYGMGYQFTDQ
ncbi:MAG: response regulator transcription factor [Microbacter sp.]